MHTAHIVVSLLHTPPRSHFTSREARAQIQNLVTSVLDPPSDQPKFRTPQLPNPKRFLQYFNCFFLCSGLATVFRILSRRFNRIFPFRAYIIVQCIKNSFLVWEIHLCVPLGNTCTQAIPQKQVTHSGLSACCQAPARRATDLPAQSKTTF